jgi:hypothetical protein
MLKYVAATIGVVVLVWVLVIGVWGFGVATAGIYGKGEAHKQIQSADFRLQAYNSFFDQYASIKSLEGQIDELTAQLEMTSKGTREYAYTLSSLTGTKGLRHTAIQKYNADAQKNWTQGQFRDNDLPYQIPDTEYPKK